MFPLEACGWSDSSFLPSWGRKISTSPTCVALLAPGALLKDILLSSQQVEPPPSFEKLFSDTWIIFIWEDLALCCNLGIFYWTVFLLFYFLSFSHYVDDGFVIVDCVWSTLGGFYYFMCSYTSDSRATSVFLLLLLDVRHTKSPNDFERSLKSAFPVLFCADPNLMLPVGLVLGGVNVLSIFTVILYYLFKVDIVLWFRRTFPVLYANKGNSSFITWLNFNLSSH